MTRIDLEFAGSPGAWSATYLENSARKYSYALLSCQPGIYRTDSPPLKFSYYFATDV